MDCANYFTNWDDKIFIFSVKIHVFRKKNFDVLKNEIFKKQTKNTKTWCIKNQKLLKTLNFNIFKMYITKI